MIVGIIITALVSLIAIAALSNKIYDAQEKKKKETFLKTAPDRVAQKNQLMSNETGEQAVGHYLIKINKQKILYASEKQYFLMHKYASERYPIDGNPCDSIAWWGKYKDSGNELYLLEDGDEFVQKLVSDDGFHVPMHYKGGHFSPQRAYPYRERIASEYIEILKEKVQGDNSCPSGLTINTFVYLIIRNGLIRYFHEEYVKRFNYKSADELCTAMIDKGEGEFDLVKCMYVFNLAFECGMTPPLGALRKRIFSEIDSTMNRLKYERLKAEAEAKAKAEAEKQAAETAIIPPAQEEDADLPTENEEKETKPHRFCIGDVDRMDGRAFEIFIAELFEKKGYSVSLTPSSGDFGIDVIIEDDFTKIGIQTKCYSANVPNSAVQEAVTGIRHYGLDKAMVATNSYFQPSAKTLAKENNVILWDRKRLKKEIEKYYGND